MRIAQVAPLYESVPPKLYGGTERVVSWLTEELVGMGHDVTLFASGDSLTTARLIPGCKRALRLGSQPCDPVLWHTLMLDEVFRRKDEFDVIHFHVDYMHFPLSTRENVTHLTTLHGRLDLPDLVPLYRRFRQVPLTAISDSQRSYLPYANWQATVHHGLPPDSLSLGEGKGGYVAFLGRISPEKGLDQAIQMAIGAGLHLKIAAKVDPADAAYFQTIIKPLLAHPLVEFIGEIGGLDKSKFLGDAAALLFPIAWPEPFGLVMIEAMACGTPIIAYSCGSVSEVMKEGVTGWVVKNVEEGIESLKKIGEFDREGCRAHFEKNFTSARMAQDYLRVYSEISEPECDSSALTMDTTSLMKVS